MEITINPVAEEQLPACLEVIRQSFGTVAAEFGLTEQNCPTNGAFMKIGRLRQDFDRDILMFALETGGDLAGFMQLCPKEEGVFELEKLVSAKRICFRGNRRFSSSALYRGLSPAGITG